MNSSLGAILAKAEFALAYHWKTSNGFWIQGVGLLICGLMGCQSSPPPAPMLSAEVERVISPQTIDLNLPTEQRSIRVRLWGVEAPTQQEPWAQAARLFVKSQLQDKSVQVYLLTPKPDEYGRFWGLIWVNQQLINEQLIAEGYAIASPRDVPTLASTDLDWPIDYQRLMWAQQRARLLGLGIWDPQSPLRQTPSEFRKLNPFPQS